MWLTFYFFFQPKDTLANLAIIDNSPEPEEPSAEDLLIDLEHEMGKICPWTCPNRVRVLLAKIAYDVHKAKDPGRQMIYSHFRIGERKRFLSFFAGLLSAREVC